MQATSASETCRSATCQPRQRQLAAVHEQPHLRWLHMAGSAQLSSRVADSTTGRNGLPYAQQDSLTQANILDLQAAWPCTSDYARSCNHAAAEHSSLCSAFHAVHVQAQHKALGFAALAGHRAQRRCKQVKSGSRLTGMYLGAVQVQAQQEALGVALAGQQGRLHADCWHYLVAAAHSQQPAGMAVAVSWLAQQLSERQRAVLGCEWTVVPELCFR